MINGEMVEVKKGSTDLKNVDQGTFVRFIQWAYRGYYDVVEFCIDYNEEGEAVATAADGAAIVRVRNAQMLEPEDDESEADEYTTLSKKDRLKKSFIRRETTVAPPRANRYENESYKEVFLCHARLYVFAEQYDIQPLKMLALDEIHATLAIFTLWEKRTGDIVTLLRYVYANTTESANGTEDLRSLLAQYLGFEMDTMIKDEEFKALMIEEGGALLGDFMKLVGQRI